MVKKVVNRDNKLSLIRTALKMGGAAAVTFGVLTDAQATQLVPVIADAVGVVMAVIGIVMSWNVHK